MQDNRYEVDVDEKIGKMGIGYFSAVYEGTWRKRVVAIKVLATTTPHKLFTHKKHLNHPNVLELYRASSASAERGAALVLYRSVFPEREFRHLEER